MNMEEMCLKSNALQLDCIMHWKALGRVAGGCTGVFRSVAIELECKPRYPKAQLVSGGTILGRLSGHVLDFWRA